MANKKILILPEGGINSENVVAFKGGAFEEIHCSAVITKPVVETRQLGIKSQLLFDETYEHSF